jgi:hypothetical protein
LSSLTDGSPARGLAVKVNKIYRAGFVPAFIFAAITGSIISAIASVAILYTSAISEVLTLILEVGALAGWIMILVAMRKRYGIVGIVFAFMIGLGYVAGGAFLLYAASLASGMNNIG